jgi:type II secretory pathway predicted ATPase ExeA
MFTVIRKACLKAAVPPFEQTISEEVVRDEIATAVLQGLVANPNIMDQDLMKDIANQLRGGKFIISAAYQMADAMLKVWGS